MLTLQITDKNLLDMFFKSYNEESNFLLSFISNDTMQKAKKLFKGANHQEIWKRLLIEAIHFLRINDFRESAFSKGKGNDRKKDEYKTKIIGKAALDDSSLNAYGIEELNKYFQRFSNFESILYGTDTHYRDHIEHPLRVWLIGLSLLDKYGKYFQLRAANDKIQIDEKTEYAKPSWNLIESGDSDKDNKYYLKISLAELAAMWTIIALTHDLGYPLERVDRVNDQLEKMLKEFGKIDFTPSSFTFQAQHDHLVSFILKIISSTVVCKETPTNSHKDKWYTHISPKYLAKFSRSWELFDHGIVSSLILLRSLNYFLETDLLLDQHKYLKVEDSRQFAVRSEILHAIAAHTTPKVYHLSANYLSFLLVLSDELQVLNRPTTLDMRTGNKISRDGEVTLQCEISKQKNKIKCDIKCDIIYKEERGDFSRQRQEALDNFKLWHERLRPAVDDTKRNMLFIWRIKFKETECWWSFKLDTKKPPFKQVIVWGPNKENSKNRKKYNLYDENIFKKTSL